MPRRPGRSATPPGADPSDAPRERLLHEAFELSLLLKAIFATLELASGAMLYLIGSDRIVRLVQAITFREFSEDPHDRVATWLIGFAQGFSIETEHFYAFYLAAHGLVKLALLLGMYRRLGWVYPLSMATLAAFVAYQLHRYAYTHSLGLIALSVFDVILIGLIWHEYRGIRRASRRARS